MSSRGIIGKKPTVGGTTKFSDVFSPSVNFASQVARTWPTVSGSGVYGIIFTPGATFTAPWRLWTKTSDGIYHSRPDPDTVSNPSSYIMIDQVATSPAASIICGIGGGTTTTKAVSVWQKVSNYYAEYYFLGDQISDGTAGVYFTNISFNPAGNIFLLGVARSSGTTAFNPYRWYTHSNGVFTYGGEIPAITTAYNYSTTCQSKWTFDGTSVALTSTASTGRLRVFNYSAGTFTEITVASQPGSTITFLAWSQDGVYLVAGYATLAYVYKRSGNTLTQLTTFTLVNAATDAEWTPDGRMLFLAGNTPRIFNRTGDVFTELSYPQILPPSTQSGGGNMVSFHAMSDTEIIAVNDSVITTWARNGDSLAYHDYPLWGDQMRSSSNSSGTIELQGQPRGTGYVLMNSSGGMGPLNPGVIVRW